MIFERKKTVDGKWNIQHNSEVLNCWGFYNTELGQNVGALAQVAPIQEYSNVRGRLNEKLKK